MRMPWSKSKADQLDLLDAASESAHDAAVRDAPQPSLHDRSAPQTRAVVSAAAAADGRPLVVPLDLLAEDPNNPRTEFPESELEELADDIRQRGILEPIARIARALSESSAPDDREMARAVKGFLGRMPAALAFVRTLPAGMQRESPGRKRTIQVQARTRPGPEIER